MPRPAGTEPTAPKATTSFAGTGPKGPGRNANAARAACGSISQLAVFITSQTPLMSGCPPAPRGATYARGAAGAACTVAAIIAMLARPARTQMSFIVSPQGRNGDAAAKQT